MGELALLLLLLVATPALAEPTSPSWHDRDLYIGISTGNATQTLDTAIALQRAGDREALRDHVRSYPWYTPERHRSVDVDKSR